jgi:hypothetical protein
MIIIAILYDLQTNEPMSYDNQVNSSVYPERTGTRYKYFVPYEPIARQYPDQRYYDYSKVETPLSIEHPVYTVYSQWLIEHVYTKRSVSDIVISLENAKRVANATWIDNDLAAMATTIIIKQQNNEELEPFEEQILLDWANIGVKLMQNQQTMLNKKTQILANQEPNLDEGWERKY